jgi:crotonobetainyl-CoA:carnitine CoA-transferase CaiB-like acyl-CoA transferase
MDGPLQGVKVVELSLATSAVGAGMAAHLPGKLLQDLGAIVTRVTSARRSTLDAGVELERAWDGGKDVVEVDDDTAAAVVLPLLADADVLFVTGPEHLIEGHGIEFGALARANPRLVVVRVRPSLDAGGTHPDLDLLVEARAGVPTQIRTHRGGPALPDLQIAGTGAGLAATVGALALLYEREATGTGGWAETSLLDGVLALLPMIIGRVERMSPTTNLLWRDQGPAESLSYRCADGEYVQLWFGAKGAYEGFLEHVGDPPTEEGYNADLMSGAMVERGARWSAMFATRDRDHWLADLDGHDFRCEPVFRPGEALRDAHVREVGLAVERDGVTVAGAPLSVTSLPPASTADASGAVVVVDDSLRLLQGVRVLDLSAYLAGPVGPLVLAELGADVVKVEPVTGDVHRSMEPMFAAGQRGKRAVALDLKSPDAPRVLDAMFRWADVVHHNARVGLAERLGYDEATAHAANADVVYSFASGFGDTGPRALLPTNDQLMQALGGIEAGQGGGGQPPTFLVWGAVDVTGGWLSACGILAGLYARRRGGGSGQSVRSSLLGAALTLKSGAFLDGDEIVGGPVLDADQRGYGAAYRLYEGADGAWFALAAPDAETWARLRGATGLDALPASPPPLRTTRTARDSGGLQPEEELLVHHFATKDAETWVEVLRAAEVPVEPVPDADRTMFISRLLDDPVSRQLGRVVTLAYGERGKLEQPALPLRFGPAPRPAAPAVIPALGAQTQDFLGSLGFDAAARAALASAGAIPAPDA